MAIQIRVNNALEVAKRDADALALEAGEDAAVIVGYDGQDRLAYEVALVSELGPWERTNAQYTVSAEALRNKA